MDLHIFRTWSEANQKFPRDRQSLTEVRIAAIPDVISSAVEIGGYHPYERVFVHAEPSLSGERRRFTAVMDYLVAIGSKVLRPGDEGYVSPPGR